MECLQGSPYAAAMRWRAVKQLEFERFLREYPGSLEPHPSLGRKANFREWRDTTLGDWPGNVVATCCFTRRCPRYQITDP